MVLYFRVFVLGLALSLPVQGAEPSRAGRVLRSGLAGACLATALAGVIFWVARDEKPKPVEEFVVLTPKGNPEGTGPSFYLRAQAVIHRIVAAEDEKLRISNFVLVQNRYDHGKPTTYTSLVTLVLPDGSTKTSLDRFTWDGRAFKRHPLKSFEKRVMAGQWGGDDASAAVAALQASGLKDATSTQLERGREVYGSTELIQSLNQKTPMVRRIGWSDTAPEYWIYYPIPDVSFRVTLRMVEAIDEGGNTNQFQRAEVERLLPSRLDE